MELFNSISSSIFILSLFLGLAAATFTVAASDLLRSSSSSSSSNNNIDATLNSVERHLVADENCTSVGTYVR